MNLHCKLRPAFGVALLVIGLLALSGYGEDKFTIAVIPNSQQEVLRTDDARLQNRLEWLVTNKESLNLKMVLHVGDLLNKCVTAAPHE